MLKNVEIFIHQEGLREPVLHETHDGSTVASIKATLAADGDGDGQFFLFEEDADEPLQDHHQVRHHGDGTKILHRNRCQQITVTVRYAGQSISRDFGPGSTLDRIKHWAERKIGIDQSDAAEMSLQIAGTKDRPDSSTHVGSLVQKCCEITFDLLPSDRINGVR